MLFLVKLVNMNSGKLVWKLLGALMAMEKLFSSSQLFINLGNVLFSRRHQGVHKNKHRLDGQDFQRCCLCTVPSGFKWKSGCLVQLWPLHPASETNTSVGEWGKETEVSLVTVKTCRLFIAFRHTQKHTHKYAQCTKTKVEAIDIFLLSISIKWWRTITLTRDKN